MAASPALMVTQLSSRIGACVDGVRLGGDLDHETVDQIYQALLRHKVIFPRPAAIRRLGTPIGHPAAKYVTGNAPVITPIDSEFDKATVWHSDLTVVPNYPAVSILRAVTLPGYGRIDAVGLHRGRLCGATRTA